MNAKQKFIILGTTLLLSGCGIYTKYEPQDTVPDNLYGEEAASLSADTTSIADIDWRDFFNDPYLQALIEKGLAQNTDVQTANLRIEEAKASLLSAKLAFLPSFALSPQGSINTVAYLHIANYSKLGIGHLRKTSQCQTTSQGCLCSKRRLPPSCLF